MNTCIEYHQYSFYRENSNTGFSKGFFIEQVEIVCNKLHEHQIEKCSMMHTNCIVALRFNFSLEYLVCKKKDENHERIAV